MDDEKTDRVYKRYEGIATKVMYLTLALFIISVAFLVVKQAHTGSFFERDITLSGGTTLTFQTTAHIDRIPFEQHLESVLGQNIVMKTTTLDTQTGLTEYYIESAVQDQSLIANAIDYISGQAGITNNAISTQFIGSSLGQSFFSDTLKALIGAFVLMAAVVFAIFANKTLERILAIIIGLIIGVLLVTSTSNTSFYVWLAFSVLFFIWLSSRNLPSFYVVFAASAAIVDTMLVVNLLGLKISTGGLAAFLMLVGYSVDTDILITTKIMREKAGKLSERVMKAMRTGLTMSITTIAATLIGFFVSTSPLIKQIMLIISIGVSFDIINTWLFNAPLLLRFVKRKQKKEA